MSVIRDFEGNLLTGFGDRDANVAILDKHGQQKYFRLAGGDDLDISFTSRVCKNGYTVITGSIFSTTAVDFNGDPVQLYSTSTNIFVAKIDRHGNQVFFTVAGGGQSLDIDLDNCGNIYITGGFAYNPVLDFNGNKLEADTQPFSFVAKLNKHGKQIYYKIFNGIPRLDALSVDKCQNLYAVGSITVYENDTTFSNIFALKLDKCGKQIYFKTVGGGTPFQRAVAIDSNKCGQAIITGSININGIDFNGDKLPQNGDDRAVAFVAKLDKKGNQIYLKFAGGSESIGVDIKFYKNKIAVVTGRLMPDYTDFNDVLITGRGDADIFVATLDRHGNQLFFKNAGGTSEDQGSRLAVTKKGNIYVGGYILLPGSDFNGTVVSTSTGAASFVAKLSPDGVQKWFKIARGGSSFNGVFDLTIDSEQSVLVTGSIGTIGENFYDFENNPIVNPFTDNVFSAIYAAKLLSNGTQKLFKYAGSLEQNSRSNGNGIGSDKYGNVYISSNVNHEL